jgi:hypothetical protein
MFDLKEITKYSEEYDEAMNAELEIVKNAYDGAWGGYSIKLPNKMTGMRLQKWGDTYQPMYDATEYGNILRKYDVYYDSGLADYPRNGNTARIFYKDLEKAQAALYYLKKLNNNEEEVA